MIAANTEFVQQDLGVIERQFTNDYGVTDTAAKIEKISALVDRWKGLLAGWDGSEEALAKLYVDEIFSRVDPAAHGMN